MITGEHDQYGLNNPPTDHEVRWLRRELRIARKQLAKAGEKIHVLRCELDSARMMITVDPRGYHANLEELRAARERIDELLTQIKELRSDDVVDAEVVGAEEL